MFIEATKAGNGIVLETPAIQITVSKVETPLPMTLALTIGPHVDIAIWKAPSPVSMHAVAVPIAHILATRAATKGQSSRSVTNAAGKAASVNVAVAPFQDSIAMALVFAIQRSLVHGRSCLQRTVVVVARLRRWLQRVGRAVAFLVTPSLV